MHTETEERDFPIPRDATVASQINNTMLCGEFKTHGIVSLVQETKMASWGVGKSFSRQRSKRKKTNIRKSQITSIGKRIYCFHKLRFI